MLKYPFLCQYCNIDIWYDFEDETWRHVDHEGETCGQRSPDTYAKPKETTLDSHVAS